MRTHNRGDRAFRIGPGVIGMRPRFSDGLAAVLGSKRPLLLPTTLRAAAGRIFNLLTITTAAIVAPPGYSVSTARLLQLRFVALLEMGTQMFPTTCARYVTDWCRIYGVHQIFRAYGIVCP